MNRFFVDKSAINDNIITISDKEDVNHISKALRCKVSDIIEISDKETFEYDAEIKRILPDRIECSVIEKRHFQREPEHKVYLYQGIPKQGKMEVIVQKAVELGVYKIIPVFTERTVIQDRGNFKNKIERWQKISKEAVKQCRRGIIPSVGNAVTFDEMLDEIKNKDLNILLYENESQTTLKSVLRSFEGSSISITIGPEGGFSQTEIRKASEKGVRIATAGKTVLRTETAGIAALAMIFYELEG